GRGRATRRTASSCAALGICRPTTPPTNRSPSWSTPYRRPWPPASRLRGRRHRPTTTASGTARRLARSRRRRSAVRWCRATAAPAARHHSATSARTSAITWASMSNRVRLLFVGVCLAASPALASVDGWAQQQPAPAPAQGAGSLRVVYGPTGRPAAGLRVIIDGRGDHEAVTGPDGIAQVVLDG